MNLIRNSRFVILPSIATLGFGLAWQDQLTCQPLIHVPIISAAVGAYNRDIDKRLARKLVWPRATSIDCEVLGLDGEIFCC